mmetsp:Transcript_33260/g.105170  ORF Transcript_33260/g.105170 Transcript_33260/m.105170 type:complete len:224 (-) Transcript_33260:230-901(-)
MGFPFMLRYRARHCARPVRPRQSFRKFFCSSSTSRSSKRSQNAPLGSACRKLRDRSRYTREVHTMRGSMSRISFRERLRMRSRDATSIGGSTRSSLKMPRPWNDAAVVVVSSSPSSGMGDEKGQKLSEGLHEFTCSRRAGSVSAKPPLSGSEDNTCCKLRCRGAIWNAYPSGDTACSGDGGADADADVGCRNILPSPRSEIASAERKAPARQWDHGPAVTTPA